MNYLNRLLIVLLFIIMNPVYAETVPENLLNQYVGVATAKQHHLMEQLGDYPDWQVDLRAGKIWFGEKVYDIQIIGTYNADDQTWLWAWANTQSGFKDTILRDANTLRQYGQTHHLSWLTEKQHDDDTKENLHQIASIAVGLTQADGYYLANAGQTTALLTLREPSPKSSSQLSAAEQHQQVMNTISQMIQSFALSNPREAIRHYLQQQGYQVSEQQQQLTAQKNNMRLTATFDSLNRLIKLQN